MHEKVVSQIGLGAAKNHIKISARVTYYWKNIIYISHVSQMLLFFKGYSEIWVLRTIYGYFFSHCLWIRYTLLLISYSLKCAKRLQHLKDNNIDNITDQICWHITMIIIYITVFWNISIMYKTTRWQNDANEPFSISFFVSQIKAHGYFCDETSEHFSQTILKTELLDTGIIGISNCTLQRKYL